MNTNSSSVNIRGFKKKESTGKKIAKIIFLAVGVLFTFLAYVIAYNTGASTNYQDDINKAVSNNDYKEVARLVSYNGPYDTNSYVNNDNEKNKIQIYGTIAAESERYFTSVDGTNKTNVFQEVEYFYYYCIYNPNFSFGTIDGKNTNETGIKFYNEALDKTYTYHFIVNKDINASDYIDYPSRPEETVLGLERNILKQLDSYGFICLPISNLFVKSVNEKIGSTISRIELVNTKGEVVEGTSFDLNLDFTQDFFKDLSEYKEQAWYAYDLGQKSNKTDEEKDLEEKANEYLNNYTMSEELKNKGYDFSKYRDELYSTGLIFSSVGIALLFLLSIAIIFVLVFYFVPIKNWIFGGRHSRTNQRIVPNKKPVNEQNTATKTNFDRVNEKRKEDLAKKRAKEEEIRKNGNMIIASKVENEKIVDAEFEDKKEVNNLENVETNTDQNNNQTVDMNNDADKNIDEVKNEEQK